MNRTVHGDGPKAPNLSAGRLIMKMRIRLLIMATLAFTVLAGPALTADLGGGSAAAAVIKPVWVPSEEVLGAFDAIIAEVEKLDALSLRQKNSFLAKLKNARAAYMRAGQGCDAAGILQALLNEMAAIRRGVAAVPPLGESLYNEVRLLRLDVLNSLPRKTCGNQPRLNVLPKVAVRRSDAFRFESAFTFGEPRTWTVEEGQPPDVEVFTQIEIPGLEDFVGEPGEPGVPVLRRLLAIPREATNIRVTETHEVSETLKLNLYPFQEQGMDAPRLWVLDPPFTINREHYAESGPFPAQVAEVNSAGNVRDVQLVQLSVAAGQYYPSTDMLKLFKKVTVRVFYDVPEKVLGGPAVRSFITSASLNPFEAESLSLASGAALNAAVVGRYVGGVSIAPACSGSELLLMTHPDFRVAADTLAAWKRTAGISTEVIEVGAGTANDTAEEIDAIIEDRYNTCLIRPSYVLLLGDAEFIPPFYKATGGSPRTGTDYYYALLGDPTVTGDKLPDFAVGRIPVDTLAQANTVVAKIVQYEQTPPHEPAVPGATAFYQNAAIAAYFQCCRSGGTAGRDARGFVETSELVRNQMIAQGKSVDRIYVSNTAHTGYGGDDTPRRYYNSAALPASIGPGSGFDWFSTDAEMTAAINGAVGAGRFLVMHRGHGGWWEWEDPYYINWHAAALTNGRLAPVVFSVNCASGYFDVETTVPADGYGAADPSLVESFLRNANGGAVGVLGDTRNSPTWANNAMTRGFFDAIWPNTVPGFGDATSKRRLGDILNHAKLYLMTQVGVAGTTEPVAAADAEDELYLWHAFGDPTMKIWTSEPYVLSRAYAKYTMLASSLLVQYAGDGATITAYQQGADDMLPIGRSTVRKGQAVLDYVNQPDPDLPIIFYASRDDAEGVLLEPALVADQSNWSKPGGSVGCTALLPKIRNGRLVQSFTPSRPLLAAVDLYLKAGTSFPAAGYRATIQILDQRGAIIGSTSSLLLRKLGGSNILARFNFSRALRLKPGQPYAIRLVAPSTTILSWYTDGAYAGGTAFDCSGTALSTETDYLFVTYAPDL